MKKRWLAFVLLVWGPFFVRSAFGASCSTFSDSSRCQETQNCVWRDGYCVAESDAVVDSSAILAPAEVQAAETTGAGVVSDRAVAPNSIIQNHRTSNAIYISCGGYGGQNLNFECSVFVDISPQNGEKVSGVQNIVMQLTDDKGLADRMDVRIENRPPQRIDSPKKTTTISWDTRAEPNGSIEIRATVYDKAGATVGGGLSYPKVMNVISGPESTINPK